MQSTTIRDALIAIPGVQSVGAVDVHVLATGTTLVTARLGFGPATPTADIVSLLDVARARVREFVAEATDIVLEPEIAAPRDDANPPTDIFVIRGAE